MGCYHLDLVDSGSKSKKQEWVLLGGIPNKSLGYWDICQNLCQRRFGAGGAGGAGGAVGARQSLWLGGQLPAGCEIQRFFPGKIKSTVVFPR